MDVLVAGKRMCGKVPVHGAIVLILPNIDPNGNELSIGEVCCFCGGGGII